MGVLSPLSHGHPLSKHLSSNPKSGNFGNFVVKIYFRTFYNQNGKPTNEKSFGKSCGGEIFLDFLKSKWGTTNESEIGNLCYKYSCGHFTTKMKNPQVKYNVEFVVKIYYWTFCNQNEKPTNENIRWKIILEFCFSMMSSRK